METESSTLSLCHPPPPPPGAGHAAFPCCHYYPPFAADDLHASRSRRVRKDERHSKICTAGGMRDRRMRLSLDVARRFFALQDKLAFDKASKTVQWLLDMSKAAINHLAAASMSEDGSVLLHNDLQTMPDSSQRNNCKHLTARPMASSTRNLKRKSTNAATSSKESRARARDRARERTRERNRLRCSVDQAEADPPPAPMIHAAYVDEQQQDQPWELSGVVFPRARFHSTHGSYGRVN